MQTQCCTGLFGEPQKQWVTQNALLTRNYLKVDRR